MRILLFTETLQPGGAEMFVVRLANALSKEHEVGIVIFYENLVHTGVIEKLAARVQVFLLRVPALRHLQRLDGLFRLCNIDISLVHKRIEKEAIKVLTAFQPDIVHGHLFKTDWVISNIQKKYNGKFGRVTTIHGDYSSYYNKESTPQLLNVNTKIEATVATIDAIVCLSAEHIQFFEQHFSQITPKLHLIYNGFEPFDKKYQRRTREELGLPASGFLFGMASRGVEKKGWRKAIEAFVEAAIPNSYLILTGEGEYLSELAKNNDQTNIIFTGFTHQPLEYIQHFDVCLLPTLFPYESLPTVIIEYLYCGKPIIATDVGEIGKMISVQDDAQLAGDLLPFKNYTIDSKLLKHAMLKYFNEPSYLAKKAEYSQQAFVKFNMQNCLDLYLRVYTNALKK